jgi:hypothetical protein
MTPARFRKRVYTRAMCNKLLPNVWARMLAFWAALGYTSYQSFRTHSKHLLLPTWLALREPFLSLYIYYISETGVMSGRTRCRPLKGVRVSVA